MIRKIEIKEFKYKKDDDFTLNLNYDVTKKITLFVGGNGSGKSTTLKLILGIIEGHCIVTTEKDILTKYYNRYEHAIKNIFYIPDEVFFENEYIKVKTFIKHEKISNREIIDTSLDNTILRDLSHGNRKKLYILSALSSSKEILLIDEGTNGIDQTSKAVIIDELNKTNKQIFFSTHDSEVINKLIDKDIIYFESKS